NPKLYEVEFVCSSDKVNSYFAQRSFGIVVDKTGKKRLALNGKPYFFNGLLDQGYWPDGLLTYPSDDAVLYELNTLKKMGFNTLRKHIKVEPIRWYYHCDKLGFVVWQDFVSGGGEYKFNHIATFPFLGFKHRDDDYKYFAREDAKGRELFVKEWQETINQLKNCVCISMWTVFNEGWGQFDSNLMQKQVEAFDNTRVIESISGWHDYKNNCAIKSLHTYYTKLKVPKDSRPVTLSEFGGYSLKVSGHVFDENKFFGYKKFKTQESFIDALKTLYLKKLLPLISQGLCGAIYTQVSDVEEEINGLITYDRKVLKISCEDMNALNQALYAEMKRVTE
ncbi:MAG: glycoside hydrolase family 2, partial [Clostridia bacterium]|nr:glycoside hydrolase family 2 [Clostridia bacterium]